MNTSCPSEIQVPFLNTTSLLKYKSGEGGGCFWAKQKAHPRGIISYSLDKQSITKPHSTRHAGHAGGFMFSQMVAHAPFPQTRFQEKP